MGHDVLAVALAKDVHAVWRATAAPSEAGRRRPDRRAAPPRRRSGEGGWLLALLEAAPLDAAPRILAADLALDSPRVCDAIVRALGADLVRRAALRDAVAIDLAEPDGAGWFGAIERAVECARCGRAPLSLLLVELEDARRLPEVEAPMAARATFGRFAQAVRTVMRHRDVLASEGDTRAWVTARETSRMDGQALADRAAAAVRAAEPWRGAPMTVTIGIAVLGEDGTDAEALVGAAESEAFAAAARGVAVGKDRDPDSDGQPPIVG